MKKRDWIRLGLALLTFAIVELGSPVLAPFSRALAQTAGLTLYYTQVDASQFPRIVSYVTVVDGNGVTVGGLTENNFVVFEDGVRELPILVEEITDASNEVSVVLAMDRSGSIEEELADAKNAATTFVNLMGGADQAALVSFASDVTVDQPFTRDKALLIAAINALADRGGTAIYDASLVCADLFQNIPGRKAVILMTDGRDKDSQATLEQAVQRYTGSGIPIFAIGLGNEVIEENLRALAGASGGRYYYSPTSSDLEAIYREISTLLHHSYRITYTTHNCVMDGTTRQVRIDVNYNGQTASGTNSYVAPGQFATLAFAADSLPMPGLSFRLRLEIPAQSPEVMGLFELDAVLRFDARYLKIKDPVAQNVRIGQLFGSPSEYTINLNTNTAGELGLQVKRKSGLGRITGRGVIAEITFVANTQMPDSTELKFEIASFAGRTDAGCGVALQSQNLALYSYGLMVWPGDTNHNGAVELTDVTVLGIHWEINGPPRTGPEDQNAWMAHLAGKFARVEATHADANGTGRIDERDLFPIGLNWRKTSANLGFPKPQSDPPDGEIVIESISGARSGEHRIQLNFTNHNHAELAGLGFRVDYPGYASIVSAQAGEAWGNAPLSIENDDREKRTFAMAMIVAGGVAQYNEGTLAELVVRADASLQLEEMRFHSIVLVSPSGQMREMETTTITQTTAVPQRFVLHPVYPNPITLDREMAAGAAIRFDLPEDATVTLQVYNIAGQKVGEISAKATKAGRHTLRWDGRDEASNLLGSGTYLVKASAAGASSRTYQATQKVTIVR